MGARKVWEIWDEDLVWTLTYQIFSLLFSERVSTFEDEAVDREKI